MKFHATRIQPYLIALLSIALVAISSLSISHAADVDEYIKQRKAVVKKSKSKVLANVNGAPLTSNDLHNSAVLRKLDPGKLDDQQRKRLLSELILSELIHQESLRKELHKQPAVVAQMAYAQRNILKQTLLNEYNRKHPVTDTEVKVFYDANKKKLAIVEFHPHHILVKDRKTAVKLISDLDDGDDFAKLAKKYSADPSSSKGGDLGWVGLNSLDRQFAAALRTLKKDSYSPQPVKTRFGWHVIKLEDIRTQPAPGYDKIKETLRNNLIGERFKKYLEELKGKSKIELTNTK